MDGKQVQENQFKILIYGKKIDQLRINGLIMEYVKGHSGDKQNDRVDKIATNYSKGISIENNLKKKQNPLLIFLTKMHLQKFRNYFPAMN